MSKRTINQLLENILIRFRPFVARAHAFLKSALTPPETDEALQRWIAAAFIISATVFNLVFLFHEVSISTPDLNDNVAHAVYVQRTIQAMERGADPTDHWVPDIEMGYPAFHSYQHLPHLFVALGAWISKLRVPFLIHLTTYLILALYPVVIFISAKRLGFNSITSSSAALICSLFSTNGLLGLEFGTYAWGGFGLFPQAFGMLLLPLALSQAYLAITKGKGFSWSVLLLSATILSNVLIGYMAAGLICICAVIKKGEIRKRAVRLLLVALLSLIVVSYFIVPVVLDRDFINRSVWVESARYDSFGHWRVIGDLFSGRVFDFGRFPSLTILVLIGALISALRWKDPKNRYLLLIFIASLFLFFGRPTWNGLLNLLPMSNSLHFHRFIAGVHFAGTFSAGIALAALFGWVFAWRRRWLQVLCMLPLLLLLYPVYRERIGYLSFDHAWKRESQQCWQKYQPNLNRLFQKLSRLPPGRVYAGLPKNWGKDYKIGHVPMYSMLNQAGFDTLGFTYLAQSLNGDAQYMFDDAIHPLYDLFNVRYVVLPSGWTVPDFYSKIEAFGEHDLYEVKTSGYFSLVNSNIAVTGSKEEWFDAFLFWSRSELPGWGQYPSIFFGKAHSNYDNVLPMKMADPFALNRFAKPREEGRGIIEAERLDASAYSVRVNAHEDCFLMLKVSYHPGWRCTIDGVDAGTVMLMPSYLGVKIAEGVHFVSFNYKSYGYRKFLLGLGIVVLVLLFTMERKLLRAYFPGESKEATPFKETPSVEKVIGRPDSSHGEREPGSCKSNEAPGKRERNEDSSSGNEDQGSVEI